MRPSILALGTLALAIGAYAAQATLSPEEEKTCRDQGGCVLVTKGHLELLVKKAYDLGAESCSKGRSI